MKKHKTINPNTGLFSKNLSVNETNLMRALESIMPNKSTGGQLLSTGLSLIPGIGNILGTGVGLLDGLFGTNQPVKPLPPLKMNTSLYGNIMKDGGSPCKDCGGSLVEAMKKGGWLQKAVNPEHKGYCTPMTKSTCTPRRKAFAMTMKKHHGFHKEDGGELDKYTSGGGLSRSEDYGSKSKPYPSVANKDFAGGNRSYPIPTKADAIDALRLAGLHHRQDVRAKVFAKYPDLRKSFGGILNEGFKQYNTGSHGSGGDLPVDQNGNASNSPVAAVQNQENAVTINGKPYVMSDTLINPETGNTFNIDAANVNKKYPKSAQTEEDQNTMDFKMKRLTKLNDLMRSLKNSFEKEEGGPFIPRRIDPFTGAEYNLISDAPQEDPLTANDQLPQTDYTPEFIMRGLNPKLPNVNIATDNQSYSSGTESGNTVSEQKNNPFNFNSVAIGLKGLGLVKSLADSLTPAEVEKPILPNYNKSDKYMQEANIDYSQARQDAIGTSNVGANINRSASGNFAAYSNREQSRVANLSDSISRIDQQENNARSSLNLTRGQYEQGKALDTANRLTQNRINNQQNQANADYADEKLFTELSQVGSEFNKYQNFKEQLANNKELQQYYTNEALAILNSKNSNFQLDPDFVNKLKSGNASIDDIVRVVNMTGIKIGQN